MGTGRASSKEDLRLGNPKKVWCLPKRTSVLGRHGGHRPVIGQLVFSPNNNHPLLSAGSTVWDLPGLGSRSPVPCEQWTVQRRLSSWKGRYPLPFPYNPLLSCPGACPSAHQAPHRTDTESFLNPDDAVLTHTGWDSTAAGQHGFSLGIRGLRASCIGAALIQAHVPTNLATHLMSCVSVQQDMRVKAPEAPAECRDGAWIGADWGHPKVTLSPGLPDMF